MSSGVAVCAIGKNENRYIREWVMHYKNLGVDKVYLYDNNDVKGEKFTDVIGDLIASKFVKLIDYRGKNTPQISAYMDCYKDHRMLHNWMLFVDCDEFLVIPGSTLKDYISTPVFQKFSAILINWRIMDDNDHIKYENKPLMERFTRFADNAHTQDGFYSNNHVKSLVNCKRDVTKFRIHIHDIHSGESYCNSSGIRIDESTIDKWRSKISKPVYDKAYIKHFVTKSVEEWCRRRIIGTRAAGIKQLDYDRRMTQFFSINKRTKEKEEVFRIYKNRKR